MPTTFSPFLERLIVILVITFLSHQVKAVVVGGPYQCTTPTADKNLYLWPVDAISQPFPGGEFSHALYASGGSQRDTYCDWTGDGNATTGELDYTTLVNNTIKVLSVSWNPATDNCIKAVGCDCSVAGICDCQAGSIFINRLPSSPRYWGLHPNAPAPSIYATSDCDGGEAISMTWQINNVNTSGLEWGYIAKRTDASEVRTLYPLAGVQTVTITGAGFLLSSAQLNSPFIDTFSPYEVQVQCDGVIFGGLRQATWISDTELTYEADFSSCGGGSNITSRLSWASKTLSDKQEFKYIKTHIISPFVTSTGSTDASPQLVVQGASTPITVFGHGFSSDTDPSHYALQIEEGSPGFCTNLPKGEISADSVLNDNQVVYLIDTSNCVGDILGTLNINQQGALVQASLASVLVVDDTRSVSHLATSNIMATIQGYSFLSSTLTDYIIVVSNECAVTSTNPTSYVSTTAMVITLDLSACPIGEVIQTSVTYSGTISNTSPILTIGPVLRDTQSSVIFGTAITEIRLQVDGIVGSPEQYQVIFYSSSTSTCSDSYVVQAIDSPDLVVLTMIDLSRCSGTILYASLNYNANGFQDPIPVASQWMVEDTKSTVGLALDSTSLSISYSTPILSNWNYTTNDITCGSVSLLNNCASITAGGIISFAPNVSSCCSLGDVIYVSQSIDQYPSQEPNYTAPWAIISLSAVATVGGGLSDSSSAVITPVGVNNVTLDILGSGFDPGILYSVNLKFPDIPFCAGSEFASNPHCIPQHEDSCIDAQVTNVSLWRLSDTKLQLPPLNFSSSICLGRVVVDLMADKVTIQRDMSIATLTSLPNGATESAYAYISPDEVSFDQTLYIKGYGFESPILTDYVFSMVLCCQGSVYNAANPCASTSVLFNSTNPTSIDSKHQLRIANVDLQNCAAVRIGEFRYQGVQVTQALNTDVAQGIAIQNSTNSGAVAATNQSLTMYAQGFGTSSDFDSFPVNAPLDDFSGSFCGLNDVAVSSISESAIKFAPSDLSGSACATADYVSATLLYQNILLLGPVNVAMLVRVTDTSGSAIVAATGGQIITLEGNFPGSATDYSIDITGDDCPVNTGLPVSNHVPGIAGSFEVIVDLTGCNISSTLYASVNAFGASLSTSTPIATFANTDATLSNLMWKAIGEDDTVVLSFDQTFDSGVLVYTATMDADYDEYAFIPTCSSTCTITMDQSIGSVASGATSASVSVKYGDFKLTNIFVTAADGISQQTYIVTIERDHLAPDVGSSGMAAGVVIATLSMISIVSISALMYCHKENIGLWNPYGCCGEDPNAPPPTHDTDFKQQSLSVWQPTVTARWALGIYVTLGLFCLLFGGVFIQSSNNVVEARMRYDNIPECTTGSACQVVLEIKEDMSAPLFFYYELSNFYQNHRSYVMSVDFKQLRGDDPSYTDCDPADYYGDAFDGPDTSLNGKHLYPCGLIAQSFFTDTFTMPCVHELPDLNGCSMLTGSNWQKEGIAWDSDLETRFIKRGVLEDETQQSPRGFTLPNVDDEDFVVWMRTSHLPTFGKLYRQVIDKSLKKGEFLNITIQSNFPVEQWSGEKAIVLSTISFMGTKGYFFGAFTVFIGVVSITMALLVYVATDHNMRAHCDCLQRYLRADYDVGPTVRRNESKFRSSKSKSKSKSSRERPISRSPAGAMTQDDNDWQDGYENPVHRYTASLGLSDHQVSRLVN